MEKAIFVIVVLVWCFIGFLGGLHADREGVNYEMIIFMISALFIAVLGVRLFA